MLTTVSDKDEGTGIQPPKQGKMWGPTFTIFDKQYKVGDTRWYVEAGRASYGSGGNLPGKQGLEEWTPFQT